MDSNLKVMDELLDVVGIDQIAERSQLRELLSMAECLRKADRSDQS